MKRKKIVILCIVFIGLLGVFFFYNMFPSKSNGVTKETENLIFSQNEKDLKAIHICNKLNELIFEQVEGNDGLEWKVKNAEASIDEVKLFETIQSLTNIEAINIIKEDTGNLAEYGLASTEIKAILVSRDGGKQTLLLGNPLPTGKGYYFMVEGSKTIYSVEKKTAQPFTITLNDLVLNNKQGNLNGAQFHEITYQNGADSIVMKQVTDSSSKYFSHYYLAEPYDTRPQVNESSEAFETIISVLANVLPMETVTLSASNLSDYGLDKPAVYVEVETLDGELRAISIGKQKENGIYYAQFDKEPAVYLVNLGEYSSIFAIDAFALANTTPVYTFINNVSAITINAESASYQMEYQKSEEDKTNTEMTNVNIEFLLNGQATNEEEMRGVYLDLLELNADSELADNKQSLAEKAAITMEIQFVNEEIITVQYVPYNRDFYAIVIDNQYDFVIAKDKLEKILHQLEVITHSNNS
ncbi:DUF4340 domain-containing protein [Caldibacillus lycopersici]|uniref:DUF4340 domain-containing protein n=1 Tax=Perspicuibacillus lycopersici TaxID=1325689 RepID=A0AAE3LSD7_9BACI|nr:DUF4340 domain-containing protein [Perspicuibacillus lycopersici]MCU9612628.1 DUF4340 domain-containing protein [Perspicuibacillus lycopersici]